MDLLNQDTDISPGERIPALAQVFNNQGILQLAQGKEEQAIATWKQAREGYEEAGE